RRVKSAMPKIAIAAGFSLAIAFLDAGRVAAAPPCCNTALGTNALQADVSATDGDRNTGIGFEALKVNKDNFANDNTAVGSQALTANKQGGNNTAIGSKAGASNTGGSHMTAVGTAALFSNTTGQSNTGIGEFALYN